MRILAAAVRVFARYGFHYSKISEIAKEAGVADGTIYLYFKNKDDILISTFEEMMGRLVERIEAEIATVAGPIEKLRRFFDFHAEMIEEHRDLGEVLTVELRQSHKFMKEYRPAPFARYLKIISNIIREGKDQGVFAPGINPGVMKRAIYGALDELAVNYLLAPTRKYDLRTATRQVCEVLVNGMLARP